MSNYYGTLYANSQKSRSYTGAKNKTKHPDFIEICKKSQMQLRASLWKFLNNCYGRDNVVCEDGFIYAKGTIPVLVTAHMDTVHDNLVEDFYEDHTGGKTKISSPQGIGGDDRCGIYMIEKLILDGYRPYVIFCEDEEIGGIGSNKFVKSDYMDDLKNLKFMVELDRAHEKDAVFYNCDNDDFTDFIEQETGYVTAYGSFSDISHLAPAAGVAAVNLSCGYYNPHTLSEYVIFEEMINTLKVTEKLLDRAMNDDVPSYEYKERVVRNRGHWGSYWAGGYTSFEDLVADDFTSSFRTKEVEEAEEVEETQEEETELYIVFKSKSGDYEDVMLCGASQSELWLKFFQMHPDVCWNDIEDYE